MLRVIATIVSVALGVVLQKLGATLLQKDNAGDLARGLSGTAVEKGVFFLPLVLLAAWPLYANLPFFTSPLFWIVIFFIWWGFLYARLYAPKKPNPMTAVPVILWVVFLAFIVANIFYPIDPVSSLLSTFVEGKWFVTHVPFSNPDSLGYTASVLYFSYVFHYPLLILCSFLLSRIGQKKRCDVKSFSNTHQSFC